MDDNEMSNVCSIGPNEELLKAVETKDLQLFKNLLKCSSADFNKKFCEFRLSRILNICCTWPGKFKFVKELLSAGVVDVNCLDSELNKAPIHFAAMHGHKDVLDVLLEDPEVDVNLLDGDGNSALHLATIAGHCECIELLLDSKGVKPNLSNREGMTPACIAVTSNEKNNDLVAAYVRRPNVDLETTVQNKTLREVLNERHPHLIPFQYLYARDEEGFISHAASLNQYEGDDGTYTYLQYACTFGLAKVVGRLLEHGVDPNGSVHDCHDDLWLIISYPVFIAAGYGYAEILQLFLDSGNPNVIYQMDGEKCTYYTSALHLLIENSVKKSWVPNPGLCDYDKSFGLLLPTCSSLDVDYADSRGDTCLHSAAYVENTNYIHQLLNHGASVGKRNRFGTSPLEEIGVNTMRSYLNNCIRSSGTCMTSEYEIEFSYEFLRPYRSRRHKHIIGHRERQVENSTEIAKNIPETNQLFYISQFSEYRSLLQHPVLATVINSKWSKVQRFYLLNLVFYMCFLSLLTAYILLFTTFENPNKTLIDLCWFWVLGNLMVFSVRELFQFTLSPMKYLSDSENWLEISLILITLSLLCEDLFEGENTSKGLRYQCSAIAIMVSWGEFILILGKHPKFAVPLAMFKLVSKTFLTFLLWYSILIIAFVLSFYVLFTNNSSDKNDNKFDNVFLSLFKTIIMFTGEFDSSSLPFATYEIVSRLIFVLFVFLIPIVLVNLLNGLAVSDTQRIQKDAETIVNVSRLRFIHSFETIILSNKYFIQLLSTLFFDVNINLFPDPVKCHVLKIYPNLRSYNLRKKQKRFCAVNFSAFEVNNEIVNDAKTLMKSMKKKTSKNYEKDDNILIEEIEELERILVSMKRKKKYSDL